MSKNRGDIDSTYDYELTGSWDKPPKGYKLNEHSYNKSGELIKAWCNLVYFVVVTVLLIHGLLNGYVARGLVWLISKVYHILEVFVIRAI